jgi:glycosyltransferase involved in cell wall biosynthesis
MISLVIPCFHESAVLELTYREIVRAGSAWDESFEIVLVDDGSQDNTWEVIESLAQRDPRVRGVRLSRNFGQYAALGAGLEHARGNAVVLLDADLQDPPSVVAEMIARWREGYQVVYGQRNQRAGESAFKLLTSDLFLRLMARITTAPIPRNTGDFALLDAQVVRALLALPEHRVFWRALRSWVGFRQTAVTFDRPARAAGETKYTVRKMARLAWDALVAFSDLPLRLALYAGMFSLGITFVAIACGFACWLFAPATMASLPSPTALAGFFLGSVQLICLGIVGEYLNRIYDEVRGRPRWIVSGIVGGPEAAGQITRPQQRMAG